MEQNNPVTELIAAQLRGAIASSGTLKKDLAKKSGISLVTLSRYLNGHRDIPAPAFVDICRALGVDGGRILNEAAKQA